ncbi:MAG: endonuclease Q family protein [Candidatus Micrarchaeota archaeon]
MPLFADFHFHSRYSRAVSPQMNLEGLNEGALAKGLGVIGTGDFTHPTWFKELKEKLVEAEAGLFALASLRSSPVRYTLTAEVASFLGMKRVHHVIHAPGFEQAAQLNDVFSKWGNLAADGRPMFGNTSSAAVVEACMSVDKNILVYGAHAFTPWFGCLGNNGGYDSIEECYEDQAKHIFAFESGMSADPSMAWRMSKLDKYTLLSN